MGWLIPAPEFTVSAQGLKTLIGRDNFDNIEHAITQLPSTKGNQMNNISTHCAIKEHVALQIPNLITRIERSKNHVARKR